MAQMTSSFVRVFSIEINAVEKGHSTSRFSLASALRVSFAASRAARAARQNAACRWCPASQRRNFSTAQEPRSPAPHQSCQGECGRLGPLRLPQPTSTTSLPLPSRNSAPSASLRTDIHSRARKRTRRWPTTFPAKESESCKLSFGPPSTTGRVTFRPDRYAAPQSCQPSSPRTAAASRVEPAHAAVAQLALKRSDS